VPAGELATGAHVRLGPHVVNGRLVGHTEDVTLERRAEAVTADLVRLWWHPVIGCPGSSATEHGVTVYERATIVPQLGWENHA
jgi:hypothetical protein